MYIVFDPAGDPLQADGGDQEEDGAQDAACGSQEIVEVVHAFGWGVDNVGHGQGDRVHDFQVIGFV